MKKLLEEAANRGQKAGNSMSVAAVTALRKHRVLYLRVFIVLYVAVVAAAVLASYAALKNIANPEGLAAFSGAMGLSLGGAIELLRRCWNEWSRGSLLLILLEDADEGETKKTITRLLAKL